MRHDDRVDAEIEHHLDLLTAEYAARGMSPEEARPAARRAFGRVEPMKERHRALRRWRWLDDASRDVRFGARLLLKDRWFTLAAVLVLALGIASTNTVFTLVNGILLRDLPFADPDRVVQMGRISYPDWQDWRARHRTFEAIGGAAERDAGFADDGRPADRVRIAYVSSNSFGLLGRRPVLGRDFQAADDALRTK